MTAPRRLDHALFINLDAKTRACGDMQLTVGQGEALSRQRVVCQVSTLIVMNAKALFLDESIVANRIDL